MNDLQILKYRGGSKQEQRELQLALLLHELIFSIRFSRKWIGAVVVLKSLICNLLIFIIFLTSSGQKRIHLEQLICEPDLTINCLIALKLQQWGRMVWIVVTPLLFFSIIAASCIVAAEKLARKRRSHIKKKPIIGIVISTNLLKFFFVFSITGGPLLTLFWMCSEIFQQFWKPRLEWVQFLYWGSYGASASLTLLGFAVIVGMSLLGFSWRRLDEPLNHRVAGHTDLMEHFKFLALIIFSQFTVLSNYLLGLAIICLLVVYAKLLKENSGDYWAISTGDGKIYFLSLLTECSFLSFLTVLEIGGTQFQPEFAFQIWLKFLTISLIFWKFGLNIFLKFENLMLKKIPKIWGQFTSDKIFIQTIEYFRVIRKTHLEKTSFGEILEVDPIDFEGFSILNDHLKICRRPHCRCQKLHETIKLDNSFKKRIEALKLIARDATYAHLKGKDIRRMNSKEIEMALRALDLSGIAIEASINVAHFYHQSVNSSQRIMARIALLEHKFKLQPIDTNTQRMRLMAASLGIPILVETEFREKNFLKMIQKYTDSFLRFRDLVTGDLIHLNLVKQGLWELGQLEKEYFSNFKKSNKSDNILAMHRHFVTFFRLNASETDQISDRFDKKDFEEKSDLQVYRNSPDSQFLVCSITHHHELKIIHTSKEIQEIVGWPQQNLIGINPDLLIPSQFRQAHHVGLKRYIASGLSAFISTDKDVFIVTEKDEIQPVLLKTQILLDHLNVRLVLMTKVSPSRIGNNLIIADEAGNINRVSRELAQIMAWPQKIVDFQVPFYLFFGQGPELILKYLSKAKKYENDKKIIWTLKFNGQDVIFDQMNQNNSLTEALRWAEPIEQISGNFENLNSSIIEFMTKYRDKLNYYTSNIPIKMQFRVMSLEKNHICLTIMDKTLAMLTNQYKNKRNRLFFRFILIKIFFSLGLKTKNPERKKEIRQLLSRKMRTPYPIIEKSQEKLQNLELIKDPKRSVTVDVRITSKFMQRFLYKPPFVNIFRIVTILVILAIMFLLCYKIYDVWFQMNSLALDYINLSENIFMNAQLIYLNAYRMTPLCKTQNCSNAAASAQTYIQGMLRGRIVQFYQRPSTFTLNDPLDNNTAMGAYATATNETYYSLLCESWSDIFMIRSPLKDQMLEEHLQQIWKYFRTRILNYLFGSRKAQVVSNSSIIIYFLVALAITYLTVIFSAFWAKKKYINFLAKMVLFFDESHFSEKRFRKFSEFYHMHSYIEESINKESNASTVKTVDKKLVPATMMQTTFPIRAFTLFGIFFGIAISLFLTTEIKIMTTISQPYELRTANQRMIISLVLRASEMLNPNSVLKIPDSEFNFYLNYFMEEFEKSVNFQTSLGMNLFDYGNTNICDNPSMMSYKDCKIVFGGVMTQGVRNVFYFLQNYMQQRRNSPPPPDTDELDMIMLLNMLGMYFRNFYSMIANNFSYIVDPLWPLTVVTMIGIILSQITLAVLLLWLVFHPLESDLGTSIRILNLLNPQSAFANSHIRNFVEKIS